MGVSVGSFSVHISHILVYLIVDYKGLIASELFGSVLVEHDGKLLIMHTFYDVCLCQHICGTDGPRRVLLFCCMMYDIG